MLKCILHPFHSVRLVFINAIPNYILNKADQDETPDGRPNVN